MTITLEALKNLCENYDRKLGEYPEHQHEGLAFLVYALTSLGLDCAIDSYAEMPKDKLERRVAFYAIDLQQKEEEEQPCPGAV